MTTLYKRAGSGNWSAAGSWSLTSGGGATGTVPTAADDVILDASSGALTIDGTSGSPSLCRSFVCTGFTGTLTHGSGAHLTIGDGTAGAFTLVAGMTYAPNAASVINFVSTTTGNNINSGGKTLGIVNFNGAGGGWVLQAAFNMSTRAMTLTNGTLDTNGQTVTTGAFNSNNSNTRGLTLGATAWSVSGNWNISQSATSGFTMSAGTSTITMALGGNFDGGGLTYYNLTISSSTFGTSVNTASTFNNITMTGPSSKEAALRFGGNCTINGTLTVNGNSAVNRITIESGLAGTADIGPQRTLTVNAISFSNVNVESINAAGASSPWNISAITGLSGDCGGNSNITFTSPLTLYWVHSATASLNLDASRWSASSGGAVTARVPLPQDTARFDANSFPASGKTITINLGRVPALDFTGTTNNPTVTSSYAGSLYFYGSITLVSGLTLSGAEPWVYRGKGSSTFTSATRVFAASTSLKIDCDSGTLTLGDQFEIANNASSRIEVQSGTFDANGNAIIINNFLVDGGVFIPASLTGLASASTINAGTVTFEGDISSSSTLTLVGGDLVVQGNVTLSNFGGNGTVTRSLDMGSGIWTLTGTGTVFQMSSTTNMTFDGGTAEIRVTNTSATAKTVNAGGGEVDIYKLVISGASGNGTVTINPSATDTPIGELVLNPYNSILITAGRKIILTTPPAWVGTAGQEITIGSVTAAQHFIECAAGTGVCDYLILSYSDAAGGAAFYAGSNSTDNGNNSGWIFADPGSGANYDEDITLGIESGIDTAAALQFHDNLTLAIEKAVDAAEMLAFADAVTLGLAPGVSALGSLGIPAEISLGVEPGIDSLGGLGIPGIIALGIEGDISGDMSLGIPGSIEIGLEPGISPSATLQFNDSLALAVASGIAATGSLTMPASITLGLEPGISSSMTLGIPGSVTLGLEHDIDTAGSLGIPGSVTLDLSVDLETLSALVDAIIEVSIELGLSAGVSASALLQFITSIDLGLEADINPAASLQFYDALAMGIAPGVAVSGQAAFHDSVALGFAGAIVTRGGLLFNESVTLGVAPGVMIEPKIGRNVSINLGIAAGITESASLGFHESLALGLAPALTLATGFDFRVAIELGLTGSIRFRLADDTDAVESITLLLYGYPGGELDMFTPACDITLTTPENEIGLYNPETSVTLMEAAIPDDNSPARTIDIVLYAMIN